MQTPKAKKNTSSPKFSTFDQYLFHEGTHHEVYRKMGAHPVTENGIDGVRFTLWAPGAKSASILCQAGDWSPERFPMQKGENGIFELFLPHLKAGDLYRYAILGADGILRHKSDPYAFATELRPSNASIIVGESDRAFSGTQLQQILPILHRHGVALWLPELDGPLDPNNPTHQALILVLGHDARREVLRNRHRTLTAMRVLARDEGRFLGGRVPYGYAPSTPAPTRTRNTPAGAGA
jgi:hypothetical protein